MTWSSLVEGDEGLVMALVISSYINGKPLKVMQHTYGNSQYMFGYSFFCLRLLEGSTVVTYIASEYSRVRRIDVTK